MMNDFIEEKSRSGIFSNSVFYTSSIILNYTFITCLDIVMRQNFEQVWINSKEPENKYVCTVILDVEVSYYVMSLYYYNTLYVLLNKNHIGLASYMYTTHSVIKG